MQSARPPLIVSDTVVSSRVVHWEFNHEVVVSHRQSPNTPHTREGGGSKEQYRAADCLHRPHARAR